MNDNYVLTLESPDGSIITYDIPKYYNIHEWRFVLKGLLSSITFSEPTISVILKDTSDDYFGLNFGDLDDEELLGKTDETSEQD